MARPRPGGRLARARPAGLRIGPRARQRDHRRTRREGPPRAGPGLGGLHRLRGRPSPEAAGLRQPGLSRGRAAPGRRQLRRQPRPAPGHEREHAQGAAPLPDGGHPLPREHPESPRPHHHLLRPGHPHLALQQREPAGPGAADHGDQGQRQHRSLRRDHRLHVPGGRHPRPQGPGAPHRRRGHHERNLLRGPRERGEGEPGDHLSRGLHGQLQHGEQPRHELAERALAAGRDLRGGYLRSGRLQGPGGGSTRPSWTS